MYPSKRALIPRREVAGKVGYWQRDDVTSNCSFLCLTYVVRQQQPPPTAMRMLGVLAIY
jgi:hypothetical protein